MLTPSPSDDTRDAACADIRAEVFAACDGELPPATLHAVDRHLAQCAACRERFTADAVFHGVIRQAVAIDTAPASLRERVALLLHSRATEIASA
jgi:mycothiol system anti-sigma-R factor